MSGEEIKIYGENHTKLTKGSSAKEVSWNYAAAVNQVNTSLQFKNYVVAAVSTHLQFQNKIFRAESV